MQQQIIDIIALVFEIDASTLTTESALATVEKWDSLNHMKLILALEEEFSLAINDEDAIKLLSVQEICQFIEAKAE